jgi:hypothetical protein
MDHAARRYGPHAVRRGWRRVPAGDTQMIRSASSPRTASPSSQRYRVWAGAHRTSLAGSGTPTPSPVPGDLPAEISASAELGVLQHFLITDRRRDDAPDWAIRGLTTTCPPCPSAYPAGHYESHAAGLWHGIWPPARRPDPLIQQPGVARPVRPGTDWQLALIGSQTREHLAGSHWAVIRACASVFRWRRGIAQPRLRGCARGR